MGLGLGILPAIHRHLDPIINTYVRYPVLYKRQVRLMNKIRKKDNISVLFVLTSLASWKTEDLYKAMKSNGRFSTDILITVANDEDARPSLRQYLTSKGYSYFELHEGEDIYSKMTPDIIFYEKPYESYLADENLRYDHYRKSVYCFILYAIHNSKTIPDFLFNNPLQNIAFQEYFENEDVSKEVGLYKSNNGKNNVVTGHTCFDQYLNFNKSKEIDPWKEQPTKKKRIIYAPHHTIDHQHEALPYSTFLEFGDFMLSMAEKYKDRVQFAFKPHPVLKPKLEKIWGKERTDAYYKKWSELDNCQLETGTYTSLFMFSDAMIHDCGSFQIEYHYTHNPVLYLTHDAEIHRQTMLGFAQKAFDLHYIGHCKDDIENFIQNVINDKDSLKERRIEFFNNYLLPPTGQSASQNIIDAILGEGSYK